MRTLIRRGLLPRGRDDRGAIGVLVGVLIAGGVLLGIGALVVDVGQIYGERAQLQNGSEGGALGVAKSCAFEEFCDPAAADAYANDNSNDGMSDAYRVCGFDKDGVLTSCPESTGEITDCPESPALGTYYVDVHTSTRTVENSTLLPPAFARLLLGNDDYEGKTVAACARAAWGPPETADTVAVTMSTCEWNVATGNGEDFAEYPPEPDPSYDRVLRLHDTKIDSSTSGNDGENCYDDNAVDGPGMFGWVDDLDDDCSVYIEDGTYSSDTGASAGKSCKVVIEEAWTNRTPIFIPLYSEVNGTGTNAEYTFDGFAAFIVTGYNLPGFKKSDWLDPSNDCTGSQKCINGFFIEAAMPSGGAIGGPDRGLVIINLTG